jgi:hypothetical protein
MWATAQTRRPHAPGRRDARLRRVRVGGALGGYGPWRLSRAAALLSHAVHLRLDRVVPRSYAEFRGVLDLVLGAAILVLA